MLGFGTHERVFASDLVLSNGSTSANDDPWADLLSLGAVTDEPKRSGANTGDSVKLLWDATADAEVDRGLLADQISESGVPLGSTRRMRWSWVAGGVLLAVLVTATVKVVSDLPQRGAAERKDQYSVAAQQLSVSLTPIEQSFDADGLLSNAGLSSLTGDLNRLDGAARTAAMLAAEQLPTAPIIGSELLVEELGPPRTLLESASHRAANVGERMGDAIDYSLALLGAFDLPALPAQASQADVDRIAEQLSFSIAETRMELAELPDDPFFVTFRQQASDTMTMVEQAQADYITALRVGNTASASQASLVIQESIASMREGLRPPLEEVRTWALGQIAEIRTTVTDLELQVGA